MPKNCNGLLQFFIYYLTQRFWLVVGGTMRIGFAILGTVIAVVIYFVFMVNAMPGILKPYLERKAGETVGGEAHIGSIEVYPFKLALKVRDLSANGKIVKLNWDSLHIDMQLRSIPTRSICLDELSIYGLGIVLDKQKKGDFFAQLAAEAFLARANVPVNIKRFIIQNGAVNDITPISFSIENFSTQYSAGQGNNYNLQFTGLNGGFFRWNGNLQWTPFLSEGEMEIRGLNIPFVLQSGNLNLRTHYKITEEPELGLTLRNTGLVLSNPAFVADSSRLSVKATSLQVDSLQLSTLNRTVFAGNVTLDSANMNYIMYKIPEIDSKLFEFVRYNAGAQDSANDNMFSAFVKKITNLKRWQIKIDSLHTKHAQIRMTDSTGELPTEHELKFSRLSFANITNNAADSIRFNGSALLNSGKLNLQGTANLFPVQMSGNLDINDFPVLHLQNYLSEKTWLNLRQGQVSAGLAVRFRAADDSLQRDTLFFSGEAAIDSLHLQGKNNQEFIRAQRAAIKGLNFMFAPSVSLQINDVNLQSPVMNLIWYAKSPANYSQIKKGTKAEQIPFAVNQINFNRGSLYLTDKDPATPFSYRMTAVQGNLRNLSNQKRDAKLSVQGKMGGYAPFSVKGSLNLAGKYPKCNVSMEAANQDLVVFSPYSGKYAGYRIAKGQVAFKADYAVQNNKMQGNNHVVIQHLTFGESVESSEATNLPVRLAAALLSDKNGVMDLDIAISGDLDDPEFSIGGLIWKVIKNLLGKAAAAPFKSLMALVGSNSDPETITFNPGSAQIDKSQLDVLKDLSRALTERHELQLDIYGHADSISDGNALREAQLAHGINDLKNLANTRAQNIKIELININASLGERVFVVDDGTLSKNVASLKIRER